MDSCHPPSSAIEREIQQIQADIDILQTQLSIAPTGGRIEEKFRPQTTLVGIRQNLTGNDALFSFSLGRLRSWMWVVTREDVQLYKLAGRSTLEQASAGWSREIRSGGEALQSGESSQRLSLASFPPRFGENRTGSLWGMASCSRMCLLLPCRISRQRTA